MFICFMFYALAIIHKLMDPSVVSHYYSEILLAKNPSYHSKTKHIDVQYHFVRDMVEVKRVLLVKVDTLKNVADALKKSVST